MAVGDGGFKQVAFGFDKNEVNSYISELRKKMKSMEEDMKANNKKTEEAEKLAQEADDRIQAAVKEGEAKCAEIQKTLDGEQMKTSALEEQVEKLKKELEQEKKKMSDMLLSGKGVNAEAQKAYADVLAKANDDAKVIIDEANAKAAEIVSAAEARRVAADENTNSFLAVIKTQIEALTDSYNAVSQSASELLGAEIAPVAAPVMPELTIKPAAAPVIEEVKAAPVEDAPVKTETKSKKTKEAPVKEKAPEEVPAVEEIKTEDTMPAIEEMPTAEGSGELASFDDVWGGNELAQSIYNNEKKDAVPLVNPDAKNIFGEDIFEIGKGSIEDVKESTPEEEKIETLDDIVDEVKPLDVSDVAEAAYDSGFDQDILAQTLNSNSLGEGVDDSLLEAVKAAEAAFAVQPNDIDFDMEEQEEAPAGNSEDDLMKALREAEAALNSLAPSSLDATIEDEPVVTSTSDDSSGDPWADLQKQFEAMEQSGNIPTGDDAVQQPAASSAPPVPSADDSSIWDFGSMGSSSSGDDDDMSSDFGGFGGF